MIDFELFLQSGYSFNGSVLNIERAVARAKAMGYRALGLADCDRMHGLIKFYLACKKHDIKPLLGVMITIKSDLIQEQGMLLFAKSLKGYQQLIEISSRLALSEEITRLESLPSKMEEVIAIALVDSGDFYHTLWSKDLTKAQTLIAHVQTVFPHFYLGVDLNHFAIETHIIPVLKGLHPTVITHQVLYEDHSDSLAYKYVRKILGVDSHIEDDLLNQEEDYDLKTPDTLTAMYREYPEFVRETQAMVDSVDIAFDFDRRILPKYPVPDSHTADDYLRALTHKGLEKRLRLVQKRKKSHEEYRQRLDFELGVIRSMGYSDYFLIVWDFVLYAKKNDILVGPGRGSGAGSLVAYVLGIVDVDPMEYELYFERFLNPERITMPDLDMDFPDDKRDQVIQYVKNKYGQAHVTSIVAFGTYQGKSALRDLARVMNVRDIVVDELTRYVDEEQNSIEEFIKHQPDKYQALMCNPEVNQLFSIARKMAGIPKHVSTHAAGIIITDIPITEYVPVQKGLLDMWQTQYEATDLELMGLLKVDFLGIRNLTIIDRVTDLIKEDHGFKIDMYKLPRDDQPTFELLQKTRTIGIFQLESPGMMNLIRKMQIRNFDDIAACIALFRPGPMENIPQFLRRRNHEEKIEYLHPDLEPILSLTHGIIVYQEQIMQIANVFAGYSLGEADVLRRAMSKKKESVLVEERERFVNKCAEKNHAPALSNQIYDYIVKFANYGFNKSHSVAYALVAYWMSYLKANYPNYFMTVLMDFAIGSQVATANYMQECRKMGIHILPPRINQSHKTYKVEGNHLRYPFLGIRNIGQQVAEKLEVMKAEGPFLDFIDFMRRGRELNTNVIESLIMVGAFDDFSESKQTLMENHRQIAQSLNLEADLTKIGFVYRTYPEYDLADLIEKERELLGFNLSYHPLSILEKKLQSDHLSTLTDVMTEEKRTITFVAYVRKIKKITTRTQDAMAFLELEDHFSHVDAVVFPKTYQRYQGLIEEQQIYKITGSTEERQNRMQVIVEKIERYGV
ncbi:MAG: DNA polymerase III subunit alpha [Candidatus Izemoplasmatales bacterium]|nr:DNA polymerase III subunit alpha [Candidatus Izemoplasmatales bacterium]